MQAEFDGRKDGLPTLSVVIPAYNEAHIIRRSLNSLIRGLSVPDEIIVVDNNSADNTAEIATEYAKYGVRVITETRQGVSYARTTGFNQARGEIIARIDADTIVHKKWALTIRKIFSQHQTVDVLAGDASIAELSPGPVFFGCFWYRGFRFWHERSIGVKPMVYGFNGAFRRTAWEKAADLTSADDARVSEDMDVTIALIRSGAVIRRARNMVVKARLFRSIDKEKLQRYYYTDGLTLAKHQYGNRKRWVQEER